MKLRLLIILLSALCVFAGCKEGEEVLTFEEKLERDIIIIDEYLEANDITAEIHESGIRYTMDVEGTGESPQPTSSVIVKYVGTLLNGTEFDSNSIGVNFNLGSLIPSWGIMVPLMKEGGTMTIYSPSVYGFDDGDILIFEIELVSLVRPENEQLLIDIALIDDYLEANDITAQVHTTGIRYEVIEEGTGLNPILSDVITVSYTGKYLDGGIFDEQEEIELQLINLVDAWKTILPLMKEGSKLNIYSPSLYAFGNTAFREVPPNSVVIFEIDFISIEQ